MHLFLKMLSGMADRIDPDQPAPSGESNLGLLCLQMVFCQKLFGHLPYPITTNKTQNNKQDTQISSLDIQVIVKIHFR